MRDLFASVIMIKMARENLTNISILKSTTACAAFSCKKDSDCLASRSRSFERRQLIEEKKRGNAGQDVYNIITEWSKISRRTRRFLSSCFVFRFFFFFFFFFSLSEIFQSRDQQEFLNEKLGVEDGDMRGSAYQGVRRWR